MDDESQQTDDLNHFSEQKVERQDEGARFSQISVDWVLLLVLLHPVWFSLKCLFFFSKASNYIFSDRTFPGAANVPQQTGKWFAFSKSWRIFLDLFPHETLLIQGPLQTTCRFKAMNMNLCANGLSGVTSIADSFRGWEDHHGVCSAGKVSLSKTELQANLPDKAKPWLSPRVQQVCFQKVFQERSTRKDLTTSACLCALRAWCSHSIMISLSYLNSSFPNKSKLSFVLKNSQSTVYEGLGLPLLWKGIQRNVAREAARKDQTWGARKSYWFQCFWLKRHPSVAEKHHFGCFSSGRNNGEGHCHYFPRTVLCDWMTHHLGCALTEWSSPWTVGCIFRMQNNYDLSHYEWLTGLFFWRTRKSAMNAANSLKVWTRWEGT